MGDVDGEAVHRNPFPDPDADGGELAVADPDAGEAGAAAGGDAEVLAGEDEDFFEFSEMLVQVLAACGEVKDGVADELAGAVVGGLPAAVGFVKGVGQGGGIAEGGLVAEAADGVNGEVLEEENRVFRAASEDGGGVVLLELEPGAVGDGFREMDDVQHGLGDLGEIKSMNEGDGH